MLVPMDHLLAILNAKIVMLSVKPVRKSELAHLARVDS